MAEHSRKNHKQSLFFPISCKTRSSLHIRTRYAISKLPIVRMQVVTVRITVLSRNSLAAVGPAQCHTPGTREFSQKPSFQKVIRLIPENENGGRTIIFSFIIWKPFFALGHACSRDSRANPAEIEQMRKGRAKIVIHRNTYIPAARKKKKRSSSWECKIKDNIFTLFVKKNNNNKDNALYFLSP